MNDDTANTQHQKLLRKAAGAINHNEARLRVAIAADDPVEISRALIRVFSVHLDRAYALNDSVLAEMWATHLESARIAHRKLGYAANARIHAGA